VFGYPGNIDLIFLSILTKNLEFATSYYFWPREEFFVPYCFFATGQFLKLLF